MPDLAFLEETIAEELKPVAEFVGNSRFKLEKQEDGRFEFLYYSHNSINFGFSLDLSDKISFEGGYFLEGDMLGKGWGRKLVEIQESVCKKAGVNTILINQNWNSPFWKHMGYKIMNPLDILKFYFMNVHFKFDQYWPRYKVLD